jgi:uncharacterized phiE125 gp8 family phage protein
MNYPIIINNVVTTAPLEEPISLVDVKAYLKLEDDDSENTLLTYLIKAARIYVENRTGRSIIQQVRTQYMDEFPSCEEIKLLHGPLYNASGTTIRSVKYYDTNDTLQTMSSGDYWIDSKSDIPRIVVKNSWPSTNTRPNAVEIEFNAGYAATEADVPSDIKNAMWLYITHFYENRVPEISGVTIGRFSFTMENILAFRVAHQNAFYINA